MSTTAEVVHEVLESRGARRRSSDCWRLGNRRSIGAQSRSTATLDLAIRADALDDTLEALKAKGYHVAQDGLPVRIELSDATSNVDLHPLHYDSDGRVLAGRSRRSPFHLSGQCLGCRSHRRSDVTCLSARQQRIFHTGYELSDIARQDMALIERHDRPR